MSLEGQDAWTEVGNVSDINPDYPKMATIGATEVALCKVGDRVFAINNQCTHANARLSDGIMDSFEIYCPLHQGSFDVRSGRALAPPCIDSVATYAIKLEAGKILINISRRGLTETVE